MRQIFTACALIFVSSLVCGLVAQEMTPDKPVPPVVRAVGLSVAQPSGAGRNSPMPLQQGTNLYLVLQAGSQRLISLDPAASKIALFADDRGTDLLRAAPSGEPAGLGPFVQVTPGGMACHFCLTSLHCPQAGASALKVKGTLVLQAGLDAKETVLKDLAFKRGTKLSAGPIEAEVQSVTVEPAGRRMETKLRLNSARPFDRIQKVAFRDGQGAEVASRISEEGVTTWMGRTVHNRTYALAGSLDKATVTVTYYDRAESIQVPIDLSVGLGL